jgi:hypothetical protein
MTAIDIDLILDKTIIAYVSDKPTSVNRVGDIVLILNDTVKAENLEGKPPWEYFALINRWSIAVGLGITSTSVGHDDQIRLISSDVKMPDISKIYDQEIGLALVQQNNNNGYQVAVGSAILSGLNISADSKSLIFRAKQFEMVRNR